MTTEIEPDSLNEIIEGEAPRANEVFAEGSRLALLRVSQYALLFIVGVVTSRALGPDLRGQFALAAALGGIGFSIFNLSLQEAAGRLIAHRTLGFRAAGKALIAGGSALGVLGAVVVVGFGAATQETLLDDLPLELILLGALLVPVSVLQHFAANLLIREGDLRGYGWISLGAAATQLVLIVAFTLGGLTPALALAASIAGSAIGALALWLRIPGQAPYEDGNSDARGSAAELVRTALRVHGASLGIAMMLGIDILLVAGFEDDRAVGLYSLAAALANLVFLGVSVISQAALHTQTVAAENDAAEFTAEFVRLSWISSILVASIVAAASWPLIRIVYGGDFTDSVPSLVILSFAAVAFAIEAPLRSFLFRARGPGIVSLFAVVGLALNIVLNLALIPAMGIEGAALASVAAYWIYAVILLRRFSSLTSIPISDVLRIQADDLRAVISLGRSAP